jgi:hypothetical protein
LQPAFVGPPTTEQVIQQINSNANSIRQLRARGASLHIPGAPSLRAELALERSRRFRLSANTTFAGTELDLGSNDELFWIWIRRAEPQAMYYCRHDQYYNSAARRLLPVEPTWLTAALGVVELDPLGRHSGPVAAGPGRLELRSIIPSPAGNLTRVMILHDTQGWIREQHLYDAHGQLLASSLASDHRRDPATGATLPHHVEIRLPPAGMSFALQVDHYEVNQIGQQDWQLWQVPRQPGLPLVDLAASGLHVPAWSGGGGGIQSGAQAPTPVVAPQASSDSRPRWSRRRPLRRLFGR